jgi:hypothetical protein
MDKLMHSHVFNLYEIENLQELKTSYRLVDIDGSFDQEESDESDLLEKNLGQLVKQVAYEEKVPVVLIRSDEKIRLAIPAERQLSRYEYHFVPEVVTLVPLEETYELSLANLTPETETIGLKFLEFDLRSPLWLDNRLWRLSNSSFFDKQPINNKQNNRDVDVYGGFGFRIVPFNGKLYLSLWLTHKYADVVWLSNRFEREKIGELKMRHLLYFYGNRWFPVQLLGLTGKNIKDQHFVPENGKSPSNVYDWTVAECGKNEPPSWIESLDPRSPAISFRYPGNQRKRYGAASLCKLLLPTQDPRVARVHHLSIKPPDERFQLTNELIERHFSNISFRGTPVQIASRPLHLALKSFSIPEQRFGGEKVLRVGRDRLKGEISLQKLGKTRLGYLLNPKGGLAESSAMDAQYYIIPESCDRSIAEDFQQRLQETVRQFSQKEYYIEPVVYYDRGKRSLKSQVDAIVAALDRAEVRNGHGILMLPWNAESDLHNYIKREFHQRIQFQCVDVREVTKFYLLETTNGKAAYAVIDKLSSKFTNYLRYTAMGLLLVNRQIPWVLECGTHYDAYIGLDVLKNTAAFTFFYEGGRQCFLRASQSKQEEKLSRHQVRQMVYESLKTDLEDAVQKPRSVVLHRDGRSYRSEWFGFKGAIEQLIQEGILPKDVQFGLVEVYKSSAAGYRLVSKLKQAIKNPQVGSWCDWNEREGIVCNTGYPFSFPGTAKPLRVRIAWGDLAIEKVLQDIFDMSQLCWPRPDHCIRLPIDLKLCDDFLRAIAAEADDDEAQFDDDDLDLDEVEDNELIAVLNGAD